MTAAAFAGPAAVPFLTFFEGPSITLAAAASVAIAALVMLALGRRVGAITLLVIGLMLGFTAQGLTSVLLHFAARAGGRIYGGWQDASLAGVAPAALPWLDLSDGERQRVMIARALAQTPRLLVLDEITAFLDLPSRVELMALLRARARRKGQVVLLSSHDLDLSLQLSDSVWLLDGAGGFSVGTPDELSESGAVGRAFDSDAIRFSPSHGRFEIRTAGSA